MCLAENTASHTIVAASKHRLPTDVVPTHYAITLRPDFTNFKFTGAQIVDVKVKRAVSEIKLNAKELNVTSAYVTNRDGSRLNGKVSLDAEDDILTVSFDGVVGKGKWQLHAAWDGDITTKLHGFYRSSYVGADGKQKWIASTQFEPCDARRLYPCFDEPAFKARYTPTLIVDPHLMALSNGDVVRETIIEESKELSIDYGNGLRYVTVPARTKKVVDFKTSMKMSTYLTAFVIGELAATETVDVDGTKLRVICEPSKLHMTKVALEAAQFSIRFFEKYFGIKYPGGKMDMVAVPNFAFGAMENTGLIIYRDTAVLVNELTATVNELMRVVNTVAHEIAHQWFGNLVTMGWWDELWLNEAFATFMAALVVDAFRKQWGVWNNFGLDRAGAMRVDGLAASRPVEGKIEKAADAMGAFDAITYRKGASILRQLEQYIGPKAFRDGIRIYLKRHAYKNTQGKHLWSALEESSSMPVAQIMDGWIHQAGHPLITVSASEIDGSVTLKQQPFRYNTDSIDPSVSWQVPVKLRYQAEGVVHEQWELLTEGERTVYLGENLEWVVANADGHGFYRTRYSDELAKKLTASVQTVLSPIERFNLVNDSAACLESGLVDAGSHLEVVRLFNGETDPNVWSVISASLGKVFRLISKTERPQFERFVQDLARPTWERLGHEAKDGETIQDKQVRASVMSLLGTIGGDTAVQAKAKELFASFKADKTAVPAEVVPSVIRLVAVTGNETTYDEFRTLLAGASSPQDIVRYISALASFRDAALLEKTVQALTDGSLRTQDCSGLGTQLLGNSVIAARAWEFMKSNWDYIEANYPANGLITMVAAVAAFDSPELEADVKSFFAEHPVSGGDKAVSQALEALQLNVRFRQREAGAVSTFFSADKAASPTSV